MISVEKARAIGTRTPRDSRQDGVRVRLCCRCNCRRRKKSERGRARAYLLALQGVPSERRLGFVDFDFECSTVCPTLLGLMGIWQKRLGSWARWWNTEIKVNPTQVSAHLGHPVPISLSFSPRLTNSFTHQPDLRNAALLLACPFSTPTTVAALKGLVVPR